MKKSLGALIAAATLVTGMTATPAAARYYEDDGYYNSRYNNYNRAPRCDKGRGGLVIGAVAGGLAGREIARRGNRTEGAIIGAAVGALAGRAIDRADSNCRRNRYRYR